jgi:superfamily II DNA or RNA helicase
MTEIHAVIDNVIRLRIDQIPGPVLFQVQQALTRTNPKYHFEAKRKEANRYSTIVLPPKEIQSYWEDGEWLTVPRGTKRLIESIAAASGATVVYEDHSWELDDHEFGLNEGFKLYPYQAKVMLPAMLARNGIISAPCGAGKTVIGVGLASYLRQPALFLVNRKELADQWVNTISEFTDCSASVYGSGKKQTGPYTVGMLQTIQRLSPEKMEKFCAQFGTVILDECHVAPANTFVQIMNMFPAKYRFGLTATTARKDKMEFLMHDTFGPVIAEITDDDLEDAGRLQQVDVKFVHTNFHSETTVNDFTRLSAEISGDEDRNDLICAMVVESCNNGHFPLVLSTRVQHIKTLQQKLEHLGLNCGRVIGEMKKNQREEVLAKARNNQLDVLLGTSLADQGLDVPNLSDVHLTMPTNNKQKLKQQIGRARRSKGINTICHDYVDVRMDSMVKYFRSRRGYYNTWKFSIS